MGYNLLVINLPDGASMKKKIYFFDMDGTLVDSMQWGWEKVILKYLDDRNIKYPDTIVTDLVTKGFMGIANRRLLSLHSYSSLFVSNILKIKLIERVASMKIAK